MVFAIIKEQIFNYLFPLIIGSSLALIFISLICEIFLLALLFVRRKNFVLFKDGLLLCALLLFQIVFSSLKEKRTFILAKEA